MAKHYVVRLAAVTDLHMRVEVEAGNPDQAVELAFQEASDSPDWHLQDEGPEPYEGTIEAHVVEDEHGETVQEFPITTAIDYERAGDNAALLREAVDAWPQFDTPHDQVSGADLVDWFDRWRERVKASLHGPMAAKAEAERQARAAGWISEAEYNGEVDGVRNPVTGDWAEHWQGACAQLGAPPSDNALRLRDAPE